MGSDSVTGKFPTGVAWFDDEVAALGRAPIFSRDGGAPATENLASAGLLTAARREMLESLSTFHAQTRHALALGTALFTAAGLILGFGLERNSPDVMEDARNLAAALLVLNVGLAAIGATISRTAYKLYVAAVIHAAQLHFAAGVGTHKWFEWIAEYVQKIAAFEREGDGAALPFWWRPLEWVAEGTSFLARSGKDRVISLWMHHPSSLYMANIYIFAAIGLISAGGIVALVGLDFPGVAGRG